MKKYMAVHGGSNSGVQTYEDAMGWAQNLLTSTKVDKVYLCEVQEVVERVAPQVRSVPFTALASNKDF